MNKIELAKFFDHTSLKQDMTIKDLEILINDYLEYGFSTICIPPMYILKAMEINKTTNIATVIDFPLGYSGLTSKLCQANIALEEGATEIDLVASVPHIKNGSLLLYANEISAIKRLMPNNILKVIIETSLLTPTEIITASQICESSGADFVKTSTGYGARGASIDDIKLIQQGAPNTKIKASGGIKTLSQAEEFIKLGVSRIGSSNSKQILDLFIIS
ncbi:MAG: deoxyribose-phosphate aldolase [Fusobacteria bacterium]|nr:MAG: deoxyribose-phosphate aldolase [Fusobacteriota bacterium]KAF0229912.1 MAG: deoxyribose-phosphate [Fusobacteriota bacterium]